MNEHRLTSNNGPIFIN